MIDLFRLGLAFMFGGLMGAAYFWALWHSARTITSSDRPWRAVVKSAGIRMGLLFGSFTVLVLLGARAEELIAWLFGFFLARIISIRLRSRSDPFNDGATS